ncbi:unnamed protein product [Agarophyton chilense]
MAVEGFFRLGNKPGKRIHFRHSLLVGTLRMQGLVLSIKELAEVQRGKQRYGRKIVTGFGGTVRTKDGDEGDDFITAIDEAKVVEDRPIKIRFNADVSAHVPWRFTPLQSEVVVLPGETVLAFYAAKNLSPEPITGIATYNVTPAKAAIYFNKVQCFCFDEQRLKPGEALDMPVFFYIDPEFASDENMSEIKDIMLSYTFFKAEDVTPEQLQRAQAAAMGQ